MPKGLVLVAAGAPKGLVFVEVVENGEAALVFPKIDALPTGFVFVAVFPKIFELVVVPKGDGFGVELVLPKMELVLVVLGAKVEFPNGDAVFVLGVENKFVAPPPKGLCEVAVLVVFPKIPPPLGALKERDEVFENGFVFVFG